MFLSRDSLLNSKNEYVQNCIARVTVEEDAYERKIRERNEEEEEILNAERLDRFRKEKENWSDKDSKREREKKIENIPEGGKSDHILEDLPTWWQWATRECQGAGKLAILRERMRLERLAVSKWMDEKNVLKGSPHSQSVEINFSRKRKAETIVMGECKETTFFSPLKKAKLGRGEGEGATTTSKPKISTKYYFELNTEVLPDEILREFSTDFDELTRNESESQPEFKPNIC